MIPNNNLSVLPFYRNIDERNAAKWWVYGRVYPLFCPSGYLPTFQILRDKRNNIRTGWPPLAILDSFPGALLADGTIDAQYTDCMIQTYVVAPDVQYISINALPQAPDGCVSVHIYTDDEGGPGDYLGAFTPLFDANGIFTGPIKLPGTAGYYIRVMVKNAEISQSAATVFPGVIQDSPQVPLLLSIFNESGTLVWESDAPYYNGYLDIKRFDVPGCDVIVYNGAELTGWNPDNGRYYARIYDGTDIWFSDIFTIVNDIEPYLKLEWWDDADFIMPAGAIVYTLPSFRNVLYLMADIAKPEYVFEEEGENRDGYFFPVKQISEKRYRFAFLAPEYLLDVMRLIRMADHIQISKAGQTYIADSFLISPEWEDNGDVAAVDAEFETDTVAKKIGRIITT